MVSPKHKRRWCRFSLLTLMVVMTVFCATVAWVASRMHRARENRDRVAAVEAAVVEIEKLGGTVISWYTEQRTQTRLEELFDDPGGADDPVSVLLIVQVNLWGDDTNVTDADLEHLKGLTNLHSLSLTSSPITDAGLEHLRGLTELESLGLSETQVTDAGLEHLKGLTKLGVLWLQGTKVTDEGVKKLQQALPNCKIYR